MSLPPELAELFRATEDAIEAYQSEVLIIGGVAPLIYRDIYKACNVQPVATKEIDIGVPKVMPCLDRDSVAELMKRAGLFPFEVHDLRLQSRPVHHFQKTKGCKQPNYVEFVTNSKNSGTEYPQPDLGAQGVKDLHILFHDPIPAQLPADAGGYTIRVPQPACFVVQQVTTYESRRTDKTLARICDVILITREAWQETAASLATAAVSCGLCGLFVKRLRTLARLFARDDADGAIGAHKELPRGSPTPDGLARIVTLWTEIHLDAVVLACGAP